MRKFRLINGKGNEYSLMDMEHWLYKPKNLGAKFSNKYEQFDARFIRTSKVSRPDDITGSVMFSGSNIYQEYRDFVKFIAIEPLTLVYTTNEEFRVSVELQELTKSEIEDGRLECELKLKRTSRWYKYVYVYNEGDLSGGKIYDYSYPYTYIEMEPETIIIDSDSGYNSPAKLTIYGPCINPSWSQYLNNDVVATGSVNATITAGHRLVIDSTTIPYTIRNLDSEGNISADLYGQSDFTTKRFITLGNGKNRIVVDHEGMNTLKVAMEGRIEYETV